MALLGIAVPDLEADGGSGDRTPLGSVDLHMLRLVHAAVARTGRYLGEPSDYQRQDGLENVVIGDGWQFLP